MDRQTFSRRKPGMVEEEKYRKYAVLIPVLTIDGEKYLLFEKRSSNLKHQPGEICFPGGKLEPGETLKKCAVRETMEELNITSRQIKVLGPGDIYISPFRLIIHSYIGELRDYNDTFSTDEVEEIIKVPLDYLKSITPETYESMLITEPPEDFPYEWIPGGNQYSWTKGTRDILFYRYENWVIWGMTAQILQSCLELMKQYHLFDSMKEER
ncbi:NUDIX hydrolase [Lacrimispora sp. AGF001]|uniref:NUDIX hydrolase n=1 Tax=Lacrimispora sp. AGF001 TaxID=3401631 RepID=UPI003B428EC9|nr:CoA pyrophosphatase [Paenibacillaceae bacterium]